MLGFTEPGYMINRRVGNLSYFEQPNPELSYMYQHFIDVLNGRFFVAQSAKNNFLY
jgi:hypothetical protein